MADVNLFDFVAYLSAQLHIPADNIIIEPLAGGTTNLTVRARFSPPILLDDTSTTSIVLKYAPPYVASKPEFPMSPYRQTIEARALSFLAGKLDDPSPKGKGQRKPINFKSVLGKLQIPQLLRHDETADVIWISDLGGMTSMPEWLAAPSTTPAHATRAGRELGRFLALLFAATRNPSKELAAIFHNPYDRHDDIMPYNHATVIRLLTEIGAPDAVELGERYKWSYKPPSQDCICLGICDLWMGSVLVDEEGNVGLCDWEMFSRSEGGAELGMLLGSIRGLMLGPHTTPATQLVASTFVDALLTSYTSISTEPGTQSFLRRLLLAYARELFCHVEDLEPNVRLAQINSLAVLLRAAGKNVLEMRFKQISDEDQNFFRKVMNMVLPYVEPKNLYTLGRMVEVESHTEDAQLLGLTLKSCHGS